MFKPKEVTERARSSTGQSTLLMDDGLDDDSRRRRRDSGASDSPQSFSPRKSSFIAVMHNRDDGILDMADVLSSSSGGGLGTRRWERPSWWEPSGSRASDAMLTAPQIVRMAFDTCILLALAIGSFVAAYHTENYALPFVCAFLAALAVFEYAWLAYRVRLRLYLPFKLHQKQTCREMYAQIMTYTVDLSTCVVTPLALRLWGGSVWLATLLVVLVVGSVASLIAALSAEHGATIAYVTLTVSLGVACICMSPNVRDAIVLLLMYAYYVSATSILLSWEDEAWPRFSMALLDPFSLLLAAAMLMLSARAVTSKDAMESVIMALLDLGGLVYLAGLGSVFNYFAMLAKVAAQRSATAVNDADIAARGAPAGSEPLISAKAASHHPAVLLFAFLCVVWCAELGGLLLGTMLRCVHVTWSHPLAAKLSTRRNAEKLVGSLVLGVLASGIVTDALIENHILPPHMDTSTLVVGTIVAIVISHLVKLWLVSLKAVARVRTSGQYLTVGGGVVDRLDAVLVMSVVFTTLLRRVMALEADG